MVLEKSPFPDDYLGVDLFYGGAWQPLGVDLDQQAVTVAHGARSEGGTAEVSSLSFRVTNSAGKYSPRNPTSPLYGQVGRNTPARARVSLGAPWLDLEAAGSRATTPDAAALDITGDLDVRWWGARDEWNFAADGISKWSGTGNQRSWLLRLEANGTLALFWTTDGATTLEARSLVPMPPWPGEIALRATLDVNNGAGGRTARFYWAPDLSGPWTQLGPDVVATGTTSIFSGSAALTVGREPTSAASNTPVRVHGWEVRNGIDGPVVSSATIASKAIGATSFTDDQGRTWTVTGGRVSNTHVVAVCEVAEWPVDWGLKGAPSVMTQVQANGVTRRLGQGAAAVESVLFRAISGISSGMVAYWPMEDGSAATSFGAAVGSRAAAMGAEVTPAAYADFPGSAPLPTLGASRIRAEVDPAASTGDIQVRWVQRTPNDALPVAEVVLCRVEFATGTIGQLDLRLRDSDGALGLFGYDFDGNQLSGSTFFAGASYKNTSLRLSMEAEQNGSNVDARWVKLAPGDGSALAGNLTFTGRTVGRVRRVIINPQYRSLPNVAVGHLTVENQITSIFDVFGGALVGYRGELASNRMLRLARENGVAMTLRGRGAAALGEQQEETLLDLLAESAAADGGMLHDNPRALGLRYRLLRAMGDQPPAATIPYTDNLVAPFTPTDDDGLTRNRVTVERPAGTKITHELTSGPMSIQPPPTGVGIYDTSLTLNLDTDELVDRTSAWLLHVGTWDEARYPTLGVDLAHPYLLGNPGLTRRLLALAPGDRLVITDPPPWLPPRAVDVLVMGVQLEISPLHLRLRWTCVPARPYRVGYWSAGHRWSAAGTVTSGSLSATATTIPITPPAGVTWTHVDGDYDITIGGEVMTVTAVSGNTLTVTRSVNGVVKTHATGSPVELTEPSFYSR
ncbi:hypothetical protein [Promicromonospora sp. NPDC050880]|uniref:hypothetical protein n=1 Tax=Promicromonospora sp. NPDC050880 TaxID=3364406 RepID=UPI0037BBAAE9